MIMSFINAWSQFWQLKLNPQLQILFVLSDLHNLVNTTSMVNPAIPSKNPWGIYNNSDLESNGADSNQLDLHSLILASP